MPFDFCRENKFDKSTYIFTVHTTNHFVPGIANNHNRPKIKLDYEQKFQDFKKKHANYFLSAWTNKRSNTYLSTDK